MQQDNWTQQKDHYIGTQHIESLKKQRLQSIQNNDILRFNLTLLFGVADRIFITDLKAGLDLLSHWLRNLFSKNSVVQNKI